MGLGTVLGLAPRGFFIPYRLAGAIADDRPPYQPCEALFAASEPAFAEVLGWIEDQAGALTAIGGAPPPAPRWDQAWFGRLDAAAAYALVRRMRPGRIVEIGSGHSTRFLARAIADGGLATELIAIDPAPRADIAALPIRQIRAPVQQAGPAPFHALAPGDVLFIDSSHIGQPGTDVDFLFGHILPLLPAGMLVHIHDIFLPDDYPRDWRWRGYNEQILVAALLTGGGFTPIFASHYVATRMAPTAVPPVLARLALVPGTPETSLWLRKTAGPPAGG